MHNFVEVNAPVQCWGFEVFRRAQFHHVLIALQICVPSFLVDTPLETLEKIILMLVLLASFKIYL